jgi:transposase-like protein/DDE family transposase
MAKDPLDVATFVSEVADSNFGDERLNVRLRSIVGQLVKDPSLSLPQSFDAGELEGAYRFFPNPRVTPEAILAPHLDATRARCEAQGDYLVVHDSTTFSYRCDGAREGLGRIQPSNPNSAQVLFAHVSLALAADGTRRPLGIAAFKTWTRGPKPTGLLRKRWQEQIRVASTQMNGHKNAIHLADREADSYEMFHDLLKDGHRFVVRCQHDRRLEEGSDFKKLHEHFEVLPSTVDREVPLSRRTRRRTDILRKIHPAREMRVGTLSVAAAKVVLTKPSKRKAHASTSLTVNIVRVWEANPPANAAPIEWYLYTSEPIDTPEQQLAIVDYYRARWTIEDYFKAIKTGCDFESRQLQDYDALVNLLAMFATIAYRLLLIRTEAARVPDEPATTVISQDQIDVLRALGRRKLPPKPSVHDAYLAIAALGGHIKYSGKPGWLTLARGYEKLETLTEGWLAAKLQLTSDQR